MHNLLNTPVEIRSDTPLPGVEYFVLGPMRPRRLAVYGIRPVPAASCARIKHRKPNFGKEYVQIEVKARCGTDWYTVRKDTLIATPPRPSATAQTGRMAVAR
jgi:hypothetical protein